MSTRCTITARDERNAFTVYVHNNGYPHTASGIFARIEAIGPRFRSGWDPSGYEAGDFLAAVVAVFKTGAGDVYLSSGRDDHADTYFHYEVACDERRRLYVEAFRRDSFSPSRPTIWTSVAETTLFPAAS